LRPTVPDEVAVPRIAGCCPEELGRLTLAFGAGVITRRALPLRREEVSRPAALTATSAGATIVAMTTEPLRSVRDHLSELVDRVEREHERVVITRNGRDAAVLMSAVDLAELEETLSVLSDPDALADIREADAAYAQGDVVRGVDAVRRLGS
jgi:antitoxin YefM